MHGPFYNFYDNYADEYYKADDKPLEITKTELKQIISANRYKYETKGISANIQNTSITLSTAREDRGMYLQAYQSGLDSVNWKFGNIFLSLTNTELKQIAETINSHIQSCFDWENSKTTEIDEKTTLEELDSVILISDNPEWEPTPPNQLNYVSK